jgi:hypothetical protein
MINKKIKKVILLVLEGTLVKREMNHNLFFVMLFILLGDYDIIEKKMR